MTDDLRSALLALGDQPPPPDLAGSALRRMRRDRRRRTAAALVAVALVAAAAVTVPAVLAHRRPAPAATVPTPAAGPVVTAYTELGDPATGSSLLRVPATGGYVRIPVPELSPSPDGTRVLVGSTGVAGAPGYPAPFGLARRDDLLTRGLAAVRWLDPQVATTAAATPSWSPDGTKLAYGALSKGADTLRAGIVDAATGRVTATFAATAACAVCTPSWSADSRSVAVLDTQGVASYYDLRGRPQGTRAGVALPADWWAYSPDRTRYVAGQVFSPGPDSQAVYDTRTRRVVRTLTGPGEVVGWDGGDRLVRIRRPGDETPGQGGYQQPVSAVEVVTLDGRVVRRLPLPPGPAGYSVRVG
jgi:WD40-like Beta Propeller Repeat